MKTNLQRRSLLPPQLLLPLVAFGALVSSIHGQVPANSAAPSGSSDDFYMIFTGDTQFPWSDVEAVDAKGNPVTRTGVATTNNNFFQTIVQGTFAGDVCFKAWGTLFSPQGGGC
jgi:hypothetical protein